jgi:hypothetical protein
LLAHGLLLDPIASNFPLLVDRLTNDAIFLTTGRWCLTRIGPEGYQRQPNQNNSYTNCHAPDPFAVLKMLSASYARPDKRFNPLGAQPFVSTLQAKPPQGK